jgi:hypothetical protein
MLGLKWWRDISFICVVRPLGNHYSVGPQDESWQKNLLGTYSVGVSG